MTKKLTVTEVMAYDAGLAEGWRKACEACRVAAQNHLQGDHNKQIASRFCEALAERGPEGKP